MSIDRIGLNSLGVGGAGMSAKAKKAPEEKVEEKKPEAKQPDIQNKSAEEVLGFMAANAGIGVGASSSIKRAFEIAEGTSPAVVARMTEMMNKFEKEVTENMVAVQEELGLSGSAAKEVALKMIKE